MTSRFRSLTYTLCAIIFVLTVLLTRRRCMLKKYEEKYPAVLESDSKALSRGRV